MGPEKDGADWVQVDGDGELSGVAGLEGALIILLTGRKGGYLGQLRVPPDTCGDDRCSCSWPALRHQDWSGSTVQSRGCSGSC